MNESAPEPQPPKADPPPRSVRYEKTPEPRMTPGLWVALLLTMIGLALLITPTLCSILEQALH